jgi:uncharacterized protein YbjT (DUF2867 family)
MITVLGATGRTGGEVARRLVAAGERVRAVGRSATRLADVAGTEPFAGDAGDAEFLTTAMRGADAAYVVFPYDPTATGYAAEQRRLGEAAVRAAREAGVGHVVAVSSIGADVPAGTGFIAALHEQEQRLSALDAVLVLRAGSFFENFAEALESVHAAGVIADAVDPDVALPMVAVRDVAAAAADALLARDWTGTVVRELQGPRDLSYRETTAILGARIGRPDLPYVRLPDAEMVEVLYGAGFSAEAAALHVELGRAISDGTIAARQPRSSATSTPTRFEDVADDLARDFLAATR